MKILFVTRGFPSDEDPMDGNYEAVQAKAIAAKGHEVSVIVIHWQNLLHLFGSKKVKRRVEDGIQIYECSRLKLSIPHVYFPKIELWAQKLQFRRVYDQCIKQIGTPDVVHAHIILFAAPAICLKEELDLPFVITEHWSEMNAQRTSKRIMNQTSVYRIADRVVCVSEVLAANLKRKCNVDSIVINNMVSDEFFMSKKQLRDNIKFKFIAVGALRRIKRFDILVDAFALARLSKTACLDIVGEGEERGLIESKIHQNHLENQIRLLGVKSPEEVNKLLCQSDCFVLSSRLETFAIVVIEALAKGLPVIATRCGGPETFVRPEDGLLVEKENVEEFANAMKYMVDHYQDYNADEIRQHCQDNFSQDVIANKIINVYKQVIGK